MASFQRDDNRRTVVGGVDTISAKAASISAILGGTTEGLAVAIIDGSGNQVTSFGGSGGNSAASATGSAVPANADYGGVNIGGTLRGRTGVNPTGTVYAAQTDLTSVGGTSISIGQQAAAASLPVILPSATITTLTPPSNTGYALDSSLTTIDTDLKANITLHSGTNNIGVIDIADTGGNKLTTNSTTYSSKFALDGNLLGTLGTAFTTAGMVNVIGSVASGQSVSGNPVQVGADAATTLPTAVSGGQVVELMADKFGRSVVLPNAMRDLVLPMTALTLTSTTTETSLITAVANTFLDLVSLIIINTSATATQVDFRDSTGGTIRASVYVPAGDMRGVSWTTPLPQAAVNTAWTAKCGTSVASVIITGSYITNK